MGEQGEVHRRPVPAPIKQAAPVRLRNRVAKRFDADQCASSRKGKSMAAGEVQWQVDQPDMQDRDICQHEQQWRSQPPRPDQAPQPDEARPNWG